MNQIKKKFIKTPEEMLFVKSYKKERKIMPQFTFVEMSEDELLLLRIYLQEEGITKKYLAARMGYNISYIRSIFRQRRMSTFFLRHLLMVLSELNEKKRPDHLEKFPIFVEKMGWEEYLF